MRYGYLCQRNKRGLWSLRLGSELTRGQLAEHYYFLAASPVLVFDGKRAQLDDILLPSEVHCVKGPPGHLGHLSVPNPRTFVGIRANGDLVFGVYKGRSDKSPGLCFAELQNEALSLGCVTALNLDGGGSSQLWVEGRGLAGAAVVSNDPGRKIGNALVLFR